MMRLLMIGGLTPLTVLSVLAIANLIGAYSLAGGLPRTASSVWLIAPVCAGLAAQIYWIVGVYLLASLGLI